MGRLIDGAILFFLMYCVVHRVFVRRLSPIARWNEVIFKRFFDLFGSRQPLMVNAVPPVSKRQETAQATTPPSAKADAASASRAQAASLPSDVPKSEPIFRIVRKGAKHFFRCEERIVDGRKVTDVIRINACGKTLGMASSFDGAVSTVAHGLL